MTLPASVKAASERADALINQQNGTLSEEGGTPKPGNDTLAVKGDTPDPEQNTPIVDDPQQQATGDGSKPATQDQQTQPPDFETKYKTLQGKYNAEIPRLNQQVRTLQESIASLTNENAQMKGDQNKSDQDGTDYTIDPESLSEYGEEFETLAKRVNQLSDENQQLTAQLGAVSQTQGKTAYDGYINSVAARLKEKGRDFGQMNADPDFLTWLQEPHPFTGKPRHASLQEAEGALDVERTMRIFDEYTGSVSLKIEEQKSQQPPNVQPTYQNPGSDINPPTPGSQGRVWTRAEIQNLYKAKSTGAYRGKEAEFKAIEADMFAAQRDGRIR